jgi:hypothetical protein
MAQWGKSDASSNAVLWAPTSVKLAPTSTNRGNLYGNTTANAFVAGATVGMFAVDANEIAAQGGKAAHSGWVLRTTGQGGRAGRVTEEVLVAGGISTDAEDAVYPDLTIRIVTQPTDLSANSSDDEVATFAVVGATTPTGGTLSYLWQANSGSGFANVAGGTSANLAVNANTAVDGTQYRVVLSATGASNVTSSVATLTITSS